MFQPPKQILTKTIIQQLKWVYQPKSQLSQLVVNAPTLPIKLNTIQDVPGSSSVKKRVGRGRSSGLGKTCGRGMNGQKSRSGNGKPKIGFEGGQSTILKKTPKRGFTNVHAYDWKPLRLNRIQRWIDMGRLDPNNTITLKTLLDSRCVHPFKDGVKLLGDGSQYLKSKIDIQVSGATKQAIETIENKGGSLTSIYFNKLGLRAHLRPDKFINLPKQALPTRKKDIVYYSDPEKRGYLANKEDILIKKSN